MSSKNVIIFWCWYMVLNMPRINPMIKVPHTVLTSYFCDSLQVFKINQISIPQSYSNSIWYHYWIFLRLKFSHLILRVNLDKIMSTMDLTFLFLYSVLIRWIILHWVEISDCNMNFVTIFFGDNIVLEILNLHLIF